ncbi:MAG: hypothetical protein WEB53_15210, partial [Akkermansiaceae bacterium]
LDDVAAASPPSVPFSTELHVSKSRLTVWSAPNALAVAKWQKTQIIKRIVHCFRDALLLRLEVYFHARAEFSCGPWGDQRDPGNGRRTVCFYCPLFFSLARVWQAITLTRAPNSIQSASV